MQWYVKEQKEEEETPAGILSKIKAADNDIAKLKKIDEELGVRK